MTSTVLSIAGLVLLSALVASIVVVARVFSHIPERSELVEDAGSIQRELDLLRSRMADLTLAVSDGIARVDRADKRIEKTVASARRLVAASGLEHPGLDAEVEELRERDADGSPPLELFSVPENVVDDRPTGMPGVSQSDLEALRERSQA